MYPMQRIFYEIAFKIIQLDRSGPGFFPDICIWFTILIFIWTENYVRVLTLKFNYI